MNQSPTLRPFLEKMRAYTPGEQMNGPQIVKLNTNENPYPPAPAVMAEIQAALGRLRLYPNPTSEPLRRALAAYHGLEPEQVLVGNGSDEILRLLVHATIGPGGCVGMVDPTYSLFPVLSASFEGTVRVYPLVDREKLPDDVFNGPEPLFILPNPNPPIGTLYTRAEIAALCQGREGRLVAIDEAYVDFAPRDVVPLLAEFTNLVVTRTFSKSFSLAGVRVGYMLSCASLIEQFGKLKDSYNVNRLSQAAASAAIGASACMEENARRIVQTREETASALRALEYRVPESHGNFLFAIHPQAASHARQLRERGILVRYLDQPPLRDGMRISIGTPEQMARLFEALKEIVTS
jgi:histidinol-phosphate aminotransferase